MINFLKKYVSVWALLGAFVLPLNAFAANIITSQLSSTIQTGTLNGAGNEIITQKLGTGLSGTVSLVAMYLNRQSAFGQPFVKLTCYTDSGYTTLCGGVGNSLGGAISSTTVIASTNKLIYSFNMFAQTSTGAGTASRLILDSSRYYLLQYQGGGGTRIYGTAATTTWPQATTNDSNLGSIGNIYAVVYGIGGTTTIPSDTTQITSIIPAPDSRISSSSAQIFNFIGYDAPIDYDDNLEIYLRYRQITGAGMRDNGNLLTVGEDTIDIDTPGDFNVNSSSHDLSKSGWYQAYAEIRKPKYTIFGFSIPFLYDSLFSTTWKFVSGTSTPTEDTAAGLLFSTTGFTTVASSTESVTSCHVGFDFDIKTCLLYVFVPSGDQLTSLLTQAKDGFLSAYPWGYVTRIVEISQDESAGTLPTVTLTTPNTVMGHDFPIKGKTVVFDPWSTLPGSGNSLFDTATSSDGYTFRQATEPYWDSFVLFLFALSLLPTIAGIRFKPDRGGADDNAWSESESIVVSKTEKLGDGMRKTTSSSSRRKVK
jgi:hypothetical protein